MTTASSVDNDTGSSLASPFVSRKPLHLDLKVPRKSLISATALVLIRLRESTEKIHSASAQILGNRPCRLRGIIGGNLTVKCMNLSNILVVFPQETLYAFSITFAEYTVVETRGDSIMRPVTPHS